MLLRPCFMGRAAKKPQKTSSAAFGAGSKESEQFPDKKDAVFGGDVFGVDIFKDFA